MPSKKGAEIYVEDRQRVFESITNRREGLAENTFSSYLLELYRDLNHPEKVLQQLEAEKSTTLKMHHYHLFCGSKNEPQDYEDL